MPTYIGSFERDGVRYFFDYSTLIDAPTSCAMTREEYERHYVKQVVREAIQEARRHLPDRLMRAESKGTSSHTDNDLADMLAGNRAGERDEALTVDEVLAMVLFWRGCAATVPQSHAAPPSPTGE